MTPASPYPLISTNDAFAQACHLASQQPAIGLDTEFVWTKTYYPQLGLLQLGWDQEHAYLIDPIAITDPSPLTRLLANPQVTKIFHEASSDLPILLRWCRHEGLPRNIVDTRIAAGFCGLGDTMSLARLLLTQLQVVLPKTETRTNWLQRPLTPAQLQYAGDDVTYLPALYHSLHDLIDQAGNTDFLADEMRKYEQPSLYQEIPPEEYWQRISRPAYLRYTLQDYAVLQQLAAWRERLARTRDITRNRIVPDHLLALAAVKHPYTPAEVARLEGFANSPALRYSREIADLVSTAMHLPKAQWPSLHIPRLDPRYLRQCSDRIQALATKRAEARKIAPTLVATRRDADSLATHAILHEDCSDSPLLKGWRYQLLAPAIDQICSDLQGRSRPNHTP